MKHKFEHRWNTKWSTNGSTLKSQQKFDFLKSDPQYTVHQDGFFLEFFKNQKIKKFAKNSTTWKSKSGGRNYLKIYLQKDLGERSPISLSIGTSESSYKFWLKLLPQNFEKNAQFQITGTDFTIPELPGSARCPAKTNESDSCWNLKRYSKNRKARPQSTGSLIENRRFGPFGLRIPPGEIRKPTEHALTAFDSFDSRIPPGGIRKPGKPAISNLTFWTLRFPPEKFVREYKLLELTLTPLTLGFLREESESQQNLQCANLTLWTLRFLPEKSVREYKLRELSLTPLTLGFLPEESEIKWKLCETCLTTWTPETTLGACHIEYKLRSACVWLIMIWLSDSSGRNPKSHVRRQRFVPPHWPMRCSNIAQNKWAQECALNPNGKQGGKRTVTASDTSLPKGQSGSGK